MTDFIHIYNLQGRCIHSGKLIAFARGQFEPAGAPQGLMYSLRELGYVATDWCADERAGLASIYGSGETATVFYRLKSDSTQRDMRAWGVTSLLNDIRRHGESITLHEAWGIDNNDAAAAV